MNFWDGTRWVHEASPIGAVPRRGHRLFGVVAEAALITSLVFGLIAGTALAKGGRGTGNQAASACAVDGLLVTASGLPTDEVLNIMLTDASGTRGWVLGFTDTGSWTYAAPERSGPTTYEFASRTYGPDGTKYRVFAACSA